MQDDDVAQALTMNPGHISADMGMSAVSQKYTLQTPMTGDSFLIYLTGPKARHAAHPEALTGTKAATPQPCSPALHHQTLSWPLLLGGQHFKERIADTNAAALTVQVGASHQLVERNTARLLHKALLKL